MHNGHLYSDQVMSLHKLTAGDGYLYLLKSVAQQDLDAPVAPDLGSYYSEKGESPGQWQGAGLAGLREMGGSLTRGDVVTEDHMKSLFGEGFHPEREALYEAKVAKGEKPSVAMRSLQLGRAFRETPMDPTGFRQKMAIGFSSMRKTLGVDDLTDEQRAQVRDRVAREEFAKEFGREGTDAQELSGYVARRMRPAPMPVAGYDLTFSPVKSVSTLWALAPKEVADEVRAAHRDAVNDVLAWLETEVIYTRRGDCGVRTVNTQGLLAAVFEHRDSRSGDPDLHTHVAIANRVQDVNEASDRWFTIDGSTLYRATVAASERYNTRLEELLTMRLGVTFSGVERDDGLRQVREIDGVSPELMDQWSSRRSAIEARRAELAAEFYRRHGRVPTPNESVKLAQQATIETRMSKHEPRSEAEQRDVWRAEAGAVLGESEAVERMVWSALAPSTTGVERTTPIDSAADQVISVMEKSRSRWSETHLIAEAERLARGKVARGEDVDSWVRAVVAECTNPDRVSSVEKAIPLNEPRELRRADGSSVYSAPMGALFTTPQIQRAEAEILAMATVGGRKRLPETAVDVALLEQVANGKPLNAGQRALIRDVTTSGAALQLVLAPAGSGKTTAMRVVAEAWRAEGGNVVALAPSAEAGTILGEEIGASGDTLAKLVYGISHPGHMPDWAASIDDASLVIIDEAGLAPTLDLHAALDWLGQRGASVRLVGDDRQLASVGSGGVLRDVAVEVGAVSLREVMRFVDKEEAEVSLAVRDGDVSAAAWWADHGRIHATPVDAQAENVVAAWAKDVAAGLDSMMLAASREHVRELNDGARTLRVAAGEVEDEAVVTAMGGVRVGVGDLIRTRRNDRRLNITSTHWVKNGDRFTVTGVREEGAVEATHARTGHTITLPAAYVGAHVELAYAGTIHSAQGATVDTTHVLLAGGEDRQGLYVATSRGRRANHLHVPMSTDGSEHSIVRPEAIMPETAIEVVENIITRDGPARSARTTARELNDPIMLAPARIAAWNDARAAAILNVVDPVVLEQIDREANDVVEDVTAAPAWDALRVRLAEIAIEGTDPIGALADAADSRELGTARDNAAVLWWRLGGHAGASKLPVADLAWLLDIPAGVREHPTWGPYLQGRRSQLLDDLSAIQDRAREDLNGELPRWTAGLEHRPALLQQVAVWRILNGVDDHEVNPLGRSDNFDLLRQARAGELAREIEEAREQNADQTQTWQGLVDARDPRVPLDPYWPVILAELDHAAACGAEPIAMLNDALSSPLPAERPGTALWWRLHALTGSSIEDPEHRTRLLPAWVTNLTSTLGENANLVTASSDWPALVDLIDPMADRLGAPPEKVVTYLLEWMATASATPDDLATAAVLHATTLLAVHELDPELAPEVDTAAPTVDDLSWLESNPPRSQRGHSPTVSVKRDGSARPAPEPEIDVADQAWYAHNVLADQTDVATAVPAKSSPDAPGAGVDPQRRQAVLAVNAAAWRFWQEAYPGSASRELMQARFGDDLADVVPAGHADTGWTTLVDEMRRQGFTDDDLIAADLARYSSRGTLIDTYRGRVVFPVLRDGQPLGFTARRLDDAETRSPKYLNGRNTPAWEKSATLFGADDLTTHPDALPVVVEGAMDAMAITAAGRGQYVGVAPLGTAMTSEHARMLAEHHRPIVVAFDADSAGRKATHRAHEILTDLYLNPEGITLPEGKDPASILTRHGAEELHTLLTDRHPLVETLIDHRAHDLQEEHDQQNANRAIPRDEPFLERRVDMARLLARDVVALPDQWWEHYAHVIADRFDLLPESVQALIDQAGIDHQPPPPVDPATEDNEARLRAAQDRLAIRVERSESTAPQDADTIEDLEDVAPEDVAVLHDDEDDYRHNATDYNGPTARL